MDSKSQPETLISVMDGGVQLLAETAAVLSAHADLNYVVIGGWSPYLLSSTKYPHPGTLDVDILFAGGYEEKALKSFMQAMLDSGFVPSAKHNFQLFKSFEVSGQELVYNVDILHPGMKDDKSMFVGHLDLDLPMDKDRLRVKNMMSIVLPNSQVIFDEQLYALHEINGVSINLCSLEASVITKLDSCQKPKRERDSFDIYVSCLSGSFNFRKFNQVSTENKRICESRRSFIKFLNTDSKTFNNNVWEFSKDYAVDPAAEMLAKFNEN